MIYQYYQAQADFNALSRGFAGFAASWLGQSWTRLPGMEGGRRLAAAGELIARTGITHERPPYGIHEVQSGNRVVAVTEEVVHATPFCTLLRFAKENSAGQPKLLVVAPMSGHFATLLRGTVRTLLADNDVYLTDWHNARDVPTAAGSFGLDESISHVMQFLEVLGPGAHVLAVCQPAVPVLAAVSLMAQANSPDQPRSMILMAGPIDTRVSPTKVNQLANQHPIEWFEKNLIGSVPYRYRGGGRRVYPGFMQLMAFMAMNMERHTKAHRDYYENLVHGDQAAVDTHRKFYDEYMAVMDLPAEFFLQTVAAIFQRHDLPLGRLMWRGHKVEPAAIRRTALFAIEGEMDDICAIGQTMASLDLCVGLRPSMKRYHLQTGVGHYGTFSGRRWASEIYPRVRSMIQAHAA
jgi:poly(3-hydroxybutyrate) depolymerase